MSGAGSRERWPHSTKNHLSPTNGEGWGEGAANKRVAATLSPPRAGDRGHPLRQCGRGACVFGLRGRNVTSELIVRLPKVRGRLTADAPLAQVTWFRVGGPAEVMFRPPISTISALSSLVSPQMCP